MKIDLVSFPLCPFVHRITTLLHEKGVPFSIRYIDLKNKPDWFVAISPRGRVPVLEADGKVLFESAAIMEFLDETHAPRLLADDPFERARERAFISFAGDVFAALYKRATAPAEERAAAGVALDRQLDAFEQAIGEGPFFAGDRFGLVDVAMAPALQRLTFLAQRGLYSFGALERTRRWAERLADRASVQRGLPPDFEQLFLAAVAPRA